MNKKLAAFLFAIGLGVSVAPAFANSCMNYCSTALTSCLNRGTVSADECYLKQAVCEDKCGCAEECCTPGSCRPPTWD